MLFGDMDLVYERVSVEYPWIKYMMLDEIFEVFNEIFGTNVCATDLVEEGFHTWANMIRDYDARV